MNDAAESFYGKKLRITAGLLGATGILAAAYGAHGLEKIAGPEQVRWWATGAALQLVTVPALLVIALHFSRFRRPAGPLLAAGVVFFSGSLYAMALGAPRVLGAVTPLGGLLLAAGWIMTIFSRTVQSPS